MTEVENIAGYGWDSFGCFNIGDFEEGDALLVMTRAGKERGIVEKVDARRMRVFYRNKTRELRYASLNSIVLLSEPTRDWLKN